MLKTGAVLAAAALAGFAFVGPGEAGGHHNPNTTVTRSCGQGDRVTYAGPLKLWPPNHKLVNATITVTEQGESDPFDDVTLTITPTVTDTAGGDGGPNHDPDVVFPNGPMASGTAGSATVPVQLRAERSGNGEGRTYTLHWVATFDNGLKTCSSMQPGQAPFVIVVPHDKGHGGH